jgi:hypothetical protein
MTGFSKEKPPFWYWIFAIIGLCWNLLGVNQYLQQVLKSEYLKEMYPDPIVLEMVYNTPNWVMAAFAVAVFFGLLGTICLLARKKWAKPLLMISFIAVLVQMTYQIFFSGSIEYYGPLGLILPITVIVISFALVRLARKSIKHRWIN